jgi:hypothetical protein
MTPTNAQIEALMTEAAAAGDAEMVALCTAALAGDDSARQECEWVIEDARMATEDASGLYYAE